MYPEDERPRMRTLAMYYETVRCLLISAQTFNSLFPPGPQVMFHWESRTVDRMRLRARIQELESMLLDVSRELKLVPEDPQGPAVSNRSISFLEPVCSYYSADEREYVQNEPQRT